MKFRIHSGRFDTSRKFEQDGRSVGLILKIAITGRQMKRIEISNYSNLDAPDKSRSWSVLVPEGRPKIAQDVNPGLWLGIQVSSPGGTAEIRCRIMVLSSLRD